MTSGTFFPKHICFSIAGGYLQPVAQHYPKSVGITKNYYLECFFNKFSTIMQSNVTVTLGLFKVPRLPYLKTISYYLYFIKKNSAMLTELLEKLPPRGVGFGNCDVSVTVVVQDGHPQRPDDSGTDHQDLLSDCNWTDLVPSMS